VATSSIERARGERTRRSNQSATLCASSSDRIRELVLLGHPLEPRERESQLDQRQHADLRQEPGERPPRITAHQHLLAAAILRERFDAELGRQRAQPVMLVAHPLAAEIDRLPAERLRQRAAADAIARLDHRDRVAGLHELAGGGQTGQSRTDHEDLHGRSVAGSGCRRNSIDVATR
jgi:hypothetical protein